MGEKELGRFGMVPLSAGNSFSLSNDMEIVFRCKRMWKYVETPQLDRVTAPGTH